MYKHRLARLEDLETILDMGGKFHQEFVAPFWDIDYDPDSAALKTIPLIDDGLVVVTMEVESEEQEEGPIVGMVAAEYIHYAFNIHVKIAKEVVFWLNPEHRGHKLAIEMLAVLGIGAGADDCDYAAMIALQESPEHVETLYKALGYRPFERTWLRKVKQEN